MRFRSYSYRFAEEVLNSKMSIKKEIENIITNLKPEKEDLTRPKLNELFRQKLVEKGWKDQHIVFDDSKDPAAKIDFLKERAGIEIAFSHASFIGIDLLKFQTLSYSNLDKIDVGIYIVTTKDYQKKLEEQGHKWEGSLTFEKVVKYLPHFKSAIQVPIFVIGLDD